MMMHKKYTWRQRLVLAIRDIKAMATLSMQCPGCGSHNVSGDRSSWICMACGSQGQS